MKTFAISTTSFSSILHVRSVRTECFLLPCAIDYIVHNLCMCKVSFCHIDPRFLGSHIALTVTMSAARELGTNLAKSIEKQREREGYSEGDSNKDLTVRLKQQNKEKIDYQGRQ